MVFASNLGYPRIGFKRELKTALEKFWSGNIAEEELLNTGRNLRLAAWRFQETAGMDFIPSNDFSFYDHVLDTIAMVGAIPQRYKHSGNRVDLTTYFLMARGTARAGSNGNIVEAEAMEMTKWFNTNYHFIVPELEDDMRFKLSSTKCVDEFVEAKGAGLITRPVLLGPVTFLRLAKAAGGNKSRLQLEQLTDVYAEVLSLLSNAGAQWVQMDEPALALDSTCDIESDYRFVYERLSKERISILLTSYFSSLGKNLSLALNLPVHGLHLDLINGRDDLEPALKNFPSHLHLSAGVVDGHNVWRCNLENTARLLEDVAEKVGPEKLIVAPSCSLLHVPMDVANENRLAPEVKSWLAFAQQKVEEISVLTDALCCGRTEVDGIFSANAELLSNASKSELRNNPETKQRLADITDEMAQRHSPFSRRSELQQSHLNLPPLPTTTIGSFPQTKEIREARKLWRAGKITPAEYEQAMRTEIDNNVSLQEKIGIDVFVHGEPERTDMVEYFAEMLDGVAVTQHGWVQSYGSRCVKPPIIYGDVSRPNPMTVEWTKYAQEKSSKPMKGMLTGPVTMLQWAFVRDDQSRSTTCNELALAIRDEVVDLESAGIKIIQIDEPAIREGLPLKKAEWKEYLDWSVKAFRLSASGVGDETQIHTHMCYSEFGDMVEAIAAMDADVISIEATRSRMELLDSLLEVEYPNAIGPGVYDIHSPRVPSQEEMEWLLDRALKVIPPERLWVNPDCGLKTRGWKEVIPALNAMVQAAIKEREKVRVPVR